MVPPSEVPGVRESWSRGRLQARVATRSLPAGAPSGTVRQGALVACVSLGARASSVRIKLEVRRYARLLSLALAPPARHANLVPSVGSLLTRRATPRGPRRSSRGGGLGRHSLPGAPPWTRPGARPPGPRETWARSALPTVSRPAPAPQGGPRRRRARRRGGLRATALRQCETGALTMPYRRGTITGRESVSEERDLRALLSIPDDDEEADVSGVQAPHGRRRERGARDGATGKRAARERGGAPAG